MKTQRQGTFPARQTSSLRWMRSALVAAIILLGFAGAPRVRAGSPDFGFLTFYLFELFNKPSAGSTNNLGSNVGGAGDLAILCLGPRPLGSHLAKASPKLSSNSDVLYGTTSLGGGTGDGVVFAVNSDGTGYTVLHNFGGVDGNFPTAGLILSGSTLYGTTVNGGSTDNGTVFAINTNKSGFTVLHNFTARNNSPYTNSDGGNPYGALILSGNTLYGTTSDGGTGNAGTVFAINLANTNFTVLHRFAAAPFDENFIQTNSEGANPFARLVLSGQTLFGTASAGGTNGVGTIFGVDTNGSNFTVLHTFSALNEIYDTNVDGTAPVDGLILSGNTLYGTASRGGTANNGAVFSVNTNGANFTNLYSFSGGSDGSQPAGELVFSGNTMFGTTRAGGNASRGNGTVFAMNIDGTGFTAVYAFSAGNYDPDLPAVGNNLTNSDGAMPQAGLVLSGTTLYGTTSAGGPGGTGSLFSLSPLELSIVGITLSGTNLVINGSGGQSNGTYVTRVTTDLSLSLTNWAPVATNTLNASGNFTITATNAVDTKAKQRFFIIQGQ